MSTTTTGPTFTAIGKLFESMPAKPIAPDAAENALRLIMHEYVSSRNLEPSFHKDLAKDVAVLYWACIAFMQFQVLPIDGGAVPPTTSYVSLTVMRNLDEIARHSLGDFREGGNIFTHIKEARKRFEFNRAGKGSLVSLIDKYIAQPSYMRAACSVVLDTLRKTSGDDRMLPFWVHQAASVDSFTLPESAMKAVAVFSNPPKIPKKRDAQKDVKFVLDLVWEAFADLPD